MRGRLATLLIAAVFLMPAVGCGGGGGQAEGSPRERGESSTFEGSYQVKALEDDDVAGVGVYDSGSFRLVIEGAPRMVIYNRENDKGWSVNLRSRTYEEITYEDALLRAGFMPGVVMRPYFDLEDYWSEAEFRMDTMDGRSIRAFLEGPGFLPSAWLAEGQAGIIKEIRWEYSRVGEVSAANFELPEGLAPGDET